MVNKKKLWVMGCPCKFLVFDFFFFVEQIRESSSNADRESIHRASFYKDTIRKYKIPITITYTQIRPISLLLAARAILL